MNTLELSKELIAFKTVSPVTEPEIFEFLKLYLEDQGIEVGIHEINDVLNLTAEIGDGEKSVCLNGHVDVVPSGGEWVVTEPFVPLEKEGRLYGRGSADMKTGVAALVNAFIDLHNDPDFDGRVVLMVVGDEELGGEHGSKALVDKYYSEDHGFDYTIVGEPTDMNVQVGTRGVAWFDITLYGEEIHATRANLAENAVEKLPKALERLNNLKMTFENETDLPDPTSEVTVVETDSTYNSIPGEIRIGMDIRYLPSQSIEGIKKDIAVALADLDIEFNVELNIDHGGAYILKDQKFRDTVVATIQNVCGRKPDCITEGGGSDGRFFSEKGTPFIELGVNQEPVHQEDEYCDIDDLEKLKQVYRDTTKKLLG